MQSRKEPDYQLVEIRIAIYCNFLIFNVLAKVHFPASKVILFPVQYIHFYPNYSDFVSITSCYIDKNDAKFIDAVILDQRHDSGVYSYIVYCISVEVLIAKSRCHFLSFGAGNPYVLSMTFPTRYNISYLPDYLRSLLIR